MWDECLIFVQPAGMTKPKTLGQQGFASREGYGTSFAMLSHLPWTKDVIQGSGDRSKQTPFFHFYCTVSRGEKAWLCQYRYEKNCCGDQLLSQEMGMGAQHLFKFIL